ncbi:hypothetical protein JCM10213_003129 [Rhodosporidiobolus nylandii]
MASFASLPPELVEEIVELAVPPFSPSGWKKRAKTLKALCLTCKQTLPAARRLLYREMRIASSASSDLVSGAKFSSGRLPPVRHLQIEHYQYLSATREKTWDVEGHRARLSKLLREVKPEVLTAYSSCELPTEELQGITTLHFSGLLFPSDPFTREEPLRLSSVRRLTLFGVRIDDPDLVLTAANFPNLVSIYCEDTYCGEPDEDEGSDDNDANLLYFSERWVPLVSQLTALATPRLDLIADGGSFSVLETQVDWAPSVEGLAVLPSSLRVLRVVYGSYAMPWESSHLAPLLRLLNSPLFPRALSELHIAQAGDSRPDKDDALAKVQEWCAARGIALHLDCAPFESPWRSFWRFLDGVNDRLGLDV